MGRYMALLGPNTKQFWLYDEENDTYIDPPANILERADEIAFANGETADSIDAAESYLEELAEKELDWLHDGNEYDADELEP